MTDQPLFLPAVLFVVLGLPLVAGLVPRNRIYGFRSRAAMADDPSWYRINRIGGALIALTGAFYLVYAHLYPVAPGTVRGFDVFSGHTYALGVPLLLTILGVIALGRRA